MKLQHRDGSFVDKTSASSNDFFRYYVKNLGENIYEKVSFFPHCQVVETKSTSRENSTHEIDCLFQQFNNTTVQQYNSTTVLETTEPKSSSKIQEEKEPSLNALEELKKKCKMEEIDGEAPPIYEDNFQELLSMLDESSKL
jgi:hypothetical protein